MNLMETEIQLLKKSNYNSPIQDKYETWYNRKEYWKDIQVRHKLTEKFIVRFAPYLDFQLMSSTQNLSEALIEKFKDRVDWHDICMVQELQETFIEKHEDEVDWEMISQYQDLSRSFLLRNRWKLNWSNVFRNQKISDNIKTSLINSME